MQQLTSQINHGEKTEKELKISLGKGLKFNEKSVNSAFINDKFNSVFNNIFAGKEVLKDSNPTVNNSEYKINKYEVKVSKQENNEYKIKDNNTNTQKPVKTDNTSNETKSEDAAQYNPVNKANDDGSKNNINNDAEANKKVEKTEAKDSSNNKDNSDKKVKTEKNESKTDENKKTNDVKDELNKLDKLVKDLILLLKNKKLKKEDIEGLLNYLKDRGINVKDLLELVGKEELPKAEDKDGWMDIFNQILNFVETVKNVVEKTDNNEADNSINIELTFESKDDINQKTDTNKINLKKIFQKIKEARDSGLKTDNENKDNNKENSNQKINQDFVNLNIKKHKKTVKKREEDDTKKKQTKVNTKTETKIKLEDDKKEVYIDKTKNLKKTHEHNKNELKKEINTFESDNVKEDIKLTKEEGIKNFVVEDFRTNHHTKHTNMETETKIEVDNVSKSNAKDSSNQNMNFNSKNSKSDNQGQNVSKGTNTSKSTNTNNFVQNKEILDQIVKQAKLTLKDGATSMKLQLKPEFLGKMELKLHLEGNKLTAKITVENHTVLHALKDGLDDLKRMLNEMNLDVDGFELASYSENSGDSSDFEYEDGGYYSEDGSGYADSTEETAGISGTDENINYTSSELNYLA